MPVELPVVITCLGEVERVLLSGDTSRITGVVLMSPHSPASPGDGPAVSGNPRFFVEPLSLHLSRRTEEYGIVQRMQMFLKAFLGSARKRSAKPSQHEGRAAGSS